MSAKFKGQLYLSALCVLGVIFSSLSFYWSTNEIAFVVFCELIILPFMYLTYEGKRWSSWFLTFIFVFIGIISIINSLENPDVGLWLKLISIYCLYFSVIIYYDSSITAYLQSKRTKKDKKVSDLPPVVIKEDPNLSTDDFPSLTIRIKSLIVDSVVLLLMFVIIATILNSFEDVSTWVRVVLFISITVLYEPILSVTIGTVGQNIFKIKVRQFNARNKRISFWNAIIRYVVKLVLGIVSFVTIHFNKSSRSIHDLASNSIMLKKETI